MFAAALFGEINYESARLERRLKPTKTSEKITIDGRLDEPGWVQTPVAANFIQNDPKEDEAASEKTEGGGAEQERYQAEDQGLPTFHVALPAPPIFVPTR